MDRKFTDALYFLFRLPARQTAVAFSGGKDSLVVLHLASIAGIRRAVFSDTTIESQKTVDYVKEVSYRLGVEIE
ncbi:MAG: phosphoadenosine phosphosulfate reductase family protein, partial [Thermoprotei archaeon]